MLMFKGASYFSLALGPSKLRTGPASQERRVTSAGHMKAGLPGAARVRTGGCARAPLPAPGSRDVAPGT